MTADAVLTDQQANATTRDSESVSRAEGVAIVLVALIAALLVPLDDADLPMHLLTGRWILDHHAWPTVEPFAWTRMGAPFYAYSWLPEILYAEGWSGGSALGVSVVHAAMVAASVGVVVAYLRTIRAPLWAARLTLVVHCIIWLFVQPATRPQLMLAISVPLVWLGVARVAQRGLDAISLALVAIGGALAVNSHLLFPLTAVPIASMWCSPAAVGGTPVETSTTNRRAAYALAGVLALSWLCTPYLPHLIDIWRLNFHRNALFGPLSPIEEHEPGLSFLMHAAPGTWVIVGLLASGPFLPWFTRRRFRDRVGLLVAWGAGAGLFLLAIRGLVLWWLMALPLVAPTLASIPLPKERLTWRVLRVAWIVALLGLLGQPFRLWREEHGRGALSAVWRELPHPSAATLAPALSVLRCLEGSTSPKRGVTTFDFGSYLAWRAPFVSWSIDGRTIFPDSVALPEARQEVRYGAPILPPYHSADVVVVAPHHALLEVLSRDSLFTRVDTRGDSTSAQLWARRDIATGLDRCAPVP